MDDLISRADAINAIEAWYPYYPIDLQQPIDDCRNSIRELQPAQPDEDRWSRLMMYLADLQLAYAPVYGHGDEKLHEFVTGLIEELEGWTDAPPAQPQRMHAHWIIEPGKGCKCSRCGFDIGNDLDWMEYVSFCPKCGHDMRGDGNG